MRCSPLMPFPLLFAGCTWITDAETTARLDLDGDGWPYPEDCDTADPDVYPGATEVCGNGLFEDCDEDASQAQRSCAYAGDGRVDAARSVLLGGDANGYAGYDAIAGDFDGDAAGDLLIGAPGEPTDGVQSSGAVYLVRGPVTQGGDLATLGTRIPGAAGTDDRWLEMAGYALAGPADLNGDGAPDAVIGAPQRESFNGTINDEGGTSARGSTCGPGRAYVLLGPLSEDSLREPDLALEDGAGALCFGMAVWSQGDLDGDGNPDVAVGAPSWANGEVTPGVTLLSWPEGTQETRRVAGSVGHGAGAALGEGDLNGDGVPDLVVGTDDGATAQASEAFLVSGDALTGDLSLEQAAFASVDRSVTGTDFSGCLASGDLDGDGQDDLLIGAQRDDEAFDDGGAAYALLGPLDGDYLTSQAVLRVYGTKSNARFGRSVALEDLDRDGARDLLLGEPLGDVDITETGNLYVLYGDPALTGSFNADAPPADARSGLLEGRAGDDLGFKAGMIEDADGEPALWVSAVNRDDGELQHVGALLVMSTWGSP